MATSRLSERISRLKNSRKGRERSRKELESRRFQLEKLEDRHLMALVPPAILPNSGTLLNNGATLNIAPQELTFEFNDLIDFSTVADGFRLIRAGKDGTFDPPNTPPNLATDIRIDPGFLGQGEDGRQVIMRFASTLPDDIYRIEIIGAGAKPLRDAAGDEFNNGLNYRVDFNLDLGAQIIAIVPQPVRRLPNGSLSMTDASGVSTRNKVVVHFNNDDLVDGIAGAENPNFYRLYVTRNTLDPNDDTEYLPSSVVYDPATDTATLTFSQFLSFEQFASADGSRDPAKSFRLRIGTDEDRRPLTTTFQLNGTDPGSSFLNAYNIGNSITLGDQGSSAQFSQTIETSAFPLPWPGDGTDPGHRDIPAENHLGLSAAPDIAGEIPTYFYNFRPVLSSPPGGGGLPVFNLITEIQKQRAREIFDLFSRYAGVQFVETASQGITVATADFDIFNNDPEPSGPGGVIGLASSTRRLAVMDVAEVWNDQFGFSQSPAGLSWFDTAMHEIGHVLGLGHTYDLTPHTVMGEDGTLIFNSPGAEPVFPGDNDITHLQHIFSPEGRDIDMYRFVLDGTGVFTAEAFAERLPHSSNLDTAITLYREVIVDGVPTRTLVSRNDDYFSKDSFLELTLTAGTYYVGVSASGNDHYDPSIEDSGIGGTTKGDYEIKFDFRKSATNSLIDTVTPANPTVPPVIADTSNVAFDGDGNGTPGGVYNFWFRAADPTATAGTTNARTIFVDRTYVGPMTGTIAQPYNEIDLALAAAAVDADPVMPGHQSTYDIVRIIGNGGADGNLATLHDNRAYHLGFASSGAGASVLRDGASLNVPKDVTVMIDAGVIIQSQRSQISVGSNAPSIFSDRSGGSLQVLGLPGIPVHFTSYNEGGSSPIGLDENTSTSPPAPADWGGISFTADLDRADGRFNHEDVGVFLNYVNHADIRYGGGQVNINSNFQTVNAINMIDSRPTITFNRLTRNADAAMAANPDSFEETNFQAPKFWPAFSNEPSYNPSQVVIPTASRSFTLDYSRIGPEIHGNTLVEFDASTVNSIAVSGVATTNASSLPRGTGSFSHTVPAGNNRLLLVSVMTDGIQDISSVTFAGQALTLATERDSGVATGSAVSIWYLVAPPIGTADVVVSFAGNVDPSAITATNLTGVNQVDPIGNTAGANATTGTSISTSISTSAPGSLIFGAAAVQSGSSDPFTPAAGITERWDLATGASATDDIGAWGGTRAAPLPGTFTFAANASVSDDWALAAIEIRSLGVTIHSNSTNGLFVRTRTPAGGVLEELTVAGRFDDKDIVHVVQENLSVRGTPSGPIMENTAPPITLVVPSIQSNGTFSAPTDVVVEYKLVYVDLLGNEGQASDTIPVALSAGTTGAAIRLDNLNIPSGDFVGRHIYRRIVSPNQATPEFTLVGIVPAQVTTFVDTNASLFGEPLRLRVLDETIHRARLDGSLKIDPALILKLDGARFDVGIGANLLAEGLPGSEIVFTSYFDDRYGAGGIFDTPSDNADHFPKDGAQGDWAGFFFGPDSKGSIDHAYIGFGGGLTRVQGTFAGFNAVEIHEADVRIAHSTFDNNADGIGGQAPLDRFGRGFNSRGTIFVRGAQPVIVGNDFINNEWAMINANVNAFTSERVVDLGRQTGIVGAVPQAGFTSRIDGHLDNNGPFVDDNRSDNNGINGMVVRGGTLTTEAVWDDTDIVHVVFDAINIPDFHTFGGFRLESSPSESLVAKFLGDDAGITASGRPLEIDDRIGGIVQVLGQPGVPVVMTSLRDCTVGAGTTPDGKPQTDTENTGTCGPVVGTSPIVDVMLVFDDTGSFAGTAPALVAAFNTVVANLQAALPGASLAFGVSRFEEYVLSGVGGPEERPFILNQPLIDTNVPNFSTAINAALNRSAPGFGGDGPETAIEALWQVATGLGFDGNDDGDTVDSGAAGIFATQTTPGPSGDVPAFSSYTPDPTGDPGGPTIPSSGTLGGVGFRANATNRIVILATDIGYAYEPDGIDPYVGVGGVTVPAADIQLGGRNTTPGGRGASIQETIDALIAMDVKVIGLGASTAPFVRTPLESLALLTGAVDTAGNPLFFPITSGSGDSVAQAIVDAVVGAVDTETSGPGDWDGITIDQYAHDRNVETVLELEPASGNGQGNAIPDNAQSLGLLASYEKGGDENLRLGYTVHGVLNQPGDLDVYSFQGQAGTEIWVDIDRSWHALDPVVELIDDQGNVIARSMDSSTESLGDGTASNIGRRMQKTPPYEGVDFYTTNLRDPGMRLMLPGPTNTINTYHLRVRSAGGANVSSATSVSSPVILTRIEGNGGSVTTAAPASSLTAVELMRGGGPIVGTIQAGAPGVNEIQNIVFNGSETAGTFQLTFNGDTTNPIPFNASASTVQNELQQLASIGAGNVLVTSPSIGFNAWNVEFQGLLANADQPLILSSSNEIQLLTAPPGAPGSFFRVEFNGEISDPIPNNGSAFDVRAGLLALPNLNALSDITVTDVGPGQWQIDFTGTGAFANTNVPEFVAIAGNEVQQIALSGPPTGGGFFLTFDGEQTLAQLPFNADANAVRIALESLANISSGDVIVTGPVGGPWNVEFSGNYADSNVPALEVSVSEIQRIHLASLPVGGSFRLTLNGETTAAIPNNANAAAIQSALVALPGVVAGDLNVVFVATGVFDIVFSPTGSFENVNVPTIVAVAGNEVQTVTLLGVPTAGTFTLTFAGQTTAPLPYNADPVAVRLALESLSNILPGDVIVNGPIGGPWTIEFNGQFAATDVPALQVNTDSLIGGLTEGGYQLQLRLREVDEFGGATVRYANIRYAENGIRVLGQPTHSPLAGEHTEIDNAGNNNRAGAQNLGNLLNSDRGTLSINGDLAAGGDVDWFEMEIRYDATQGTSDEDWWSTIFDIDYADGFGRPNTVINVFNEQGQLVMSSRDSNIADDRPNPLNAGDVSDLNRGSSGAADPWIGPAELPQGTYYVAISNDNLMPVEYNQFFQANATNPLVRFEPINSVRRIVEDHIESDGGSTGTGPIVPNFLNGGGVIPYNLGDVTLYVVQDSDEPNPNQPKKTDLHMVDPFTGQDELRVGTFGQDIGDIAFNGTNLFAYTLDLDPANGQDPIDDAQSGNYLQINTGTGASTIIGDDGIVTYEPDAGGAAVVSHLFNNVRIGYGIQFNAMTYGDVGPRGRGNNLIAVGNRGEADLGTPGNPLNAFLTRRRNVVYQMNAASGAALVSGGSRLNGAATSAREIGEILTSPTITVEQDATSFIPTNSTQFNITDALTFTVDDGNVVTTFEFDSGPEVRQLIPIPAPVTPIDPHLNDGDFFILDEDNMPLTGDEWLFQFDTGSSIFVVDATDTALGLQDQDVFVVNDLLGRTRTFEIERGGGLAGAGNIAVNLTGITNPAAAAGIISGAIQGQNGANFSVTAAAFGQRVILSNEALVTTANSTGIVIDGNNGQAPILQGVDATSITDGEQFRLTFNGAGSPIVFEFDTAGNGVSTGVEIDLLAGDTAAIVAQKMNAAISGSALGAVTTTPSRLVGDKVLVNGPSIDFVNISSSIDDLTEVYNGLGQYFAISTSSVATAGVTIEENTPARTVGQAVEIIVNGAATPFTASSQDHRINFPPIVAGAKGPAVRAEFDGVPAWQTQASSYGVAPGNIAIPFTAEDTAGGGLGVAPGTPTIASRMAAAINATLNPRIVAQAQGGTVRLSSGFTTVPSPQFSTAGEGPGGNITGLAIIDDGDGNDDTDDLYAVSDTGGLWHVTLDLVNNSSLPDFGNTGGLANFNVNATYIRSSASDLVGINFQGLTRAPTSVENQRYNNTFFAVDQSGRLYSFGEDGVLLPVFVNGATSVATGLSNARGLGFSNLERNLWHVTPNSSPINQERQSDAGHGLNDIFDRSRIPDNGAASLHFGQGRIGAAPLNPVGTNFNGGSYGSIVSEEFSLEGYSAADQPVLYFNYFSDTEERSKVLGDGQPPMMDSFRVFAAGNDGNWQLVATNNSGRGGLPADDEYDYGTNSGNNSPPQVQELFDTASGSPGGWRQARINLAAFAGQSRLRLRFDYSSAGDMNLGDTNTTGDELRAVEGRLLTDGQTFVLSNPGGGSTTFEFEMGVHLTVSSGTAFTDGQRFRIDVDGAGPQPTRVYEFDPLSNGVSGTNIPVNITPSMTAQQVAGVLIAAINANSPGATPIYVNDTIIELQNAQSVLNGDPSSPVTLANFITGSFGLSNSTRVPIRVTRDMTRVEVANAINDVLEQQNYNQQILAEAPFNPVSGVQQIFDGSTFTLNLNGTNYTFEFESGYVMTMPANVVDNSLLLNQAEGFELTVNGVTRQFEFDLDGDLTDPGHIAVPYTLGANQLQLAQAMVTAINATFPGAAPGGISAKVLSGARVQIDTTGNTAVTNFVAGQWTGAALTPLPVKFAVDGDPGLNNPLARRVLFEPSSAFRATDVAARIATAINTPTPFLPGITATSGAAGTANQRRVALRGPDVTFVASTVPGMRLELTNPILNDVVKQHEDLIRIIGRDVLNRGPLGVDTGLEADEFGNFNSNLRAQNNNDVEGVYIDDIIIGFAERGEMVTAGNAGNDSFVTNPLASPLNVVSGSYQLEVRRGAEAGVPNPFPPPDLALLASIDTNDRLMPGRMLQTPFGASIADGLFFSLSDGVNTLTFEFNDTTIPGGSSVAPGRVRIDYTPADTAATIAQRVVRAVNSAPVQAVLKIAAQLADGVFVPATGALPIGSTTNRVNLLGAVNVPNPGTVIASSTGLPTGPEVDNGVLIDNDVPTATLGHFEVEPVSGGNLGTSLGTTSGVTAQGRTQTFVNQDWIFAFLNYVDVGTAGGAIHLGETTITTPPTRISDDLVISEGFFVGTNGLVNWRAETTLNDGDAIVRNTVHFSSATPLGSLRYVNYLDEDVVGAGGDLLYQVGTPGQPDFRLYTLDNTERIGFAQGGVYIPGDDLVNATYSGWAADAYNDLESAIRLAGTNYSVLGNIDTGDLTPFIDAQLGSVHGVADVTTAMSWVVDAVATTATITTFLELLPQDSAGLNFRTFTEQYGDRNLFRDQGQILLVGNEIRDSLGWGILVDNGSRTTADGNTPHQGPVRTLSQANSARLVPGVVVTNNLMYRNAVGGILYSGDGGIDAAVPFGRIVNNTVYGNRAGDVGIQVDNGAGPTLLNNIVAHLGEGVRVDASSQAMTVLGGMLYQDNASNSNVGLGGDFPIVLNPGDPLFVNPNTDNFYLAPQSGAIDSSIDSLLDRAAMLTVRNPLGISPSPIKAPERDLFGQVRADDDTVATPQGVGQNVFKDRGAIDRIDDTGPTSVLTAPEDNNPTVDQDPAGTVVVMPNQPVSNFVIRLIDRFDVNGPAEGSDIDDFSVNGTKLRVDVLGTGARTLIQGIDYTFDYDATNNLIILTPLGGLWPQSTTYQITLDNSATTGIRDRAGNVLLPNQLDGSHTYTIFLGTAVDWGDAPSTYGTLFADVPSGPSHGVLAGVRLGPTNGAEPDGQPSPAGDLDASDDGVTNILLQPSGLPGSSTITVDASVAGKIDVWIDLNQDGNFLDASTSNGFDAGEYVPELANRSVSAGLNVISFGLGNGARGQSFMRVRFTQGPVSVGSPHGPAIDGEVEDYQVLLTGPAFQNPSNRLDVNNDGFVAPNDALYVIDYLNLLIKDGNNQLPLPPQPPNAPLDPTGGGVAEMGRYLDVNGDGFLTAADAILIIDELNNPSGEGEGEGEGESDGLTAAFGSRSASNGSNRGNGSSNDLAIPTTLLVSQDIIIEERTTTASGSNMDPLWASQDDGLALDLVSLGGIAGTSELDDVLGAGSDSESLLLETLDDGSWEDLLDDLSLDTDGK